MKIRWVICAARSNSINDKSPFYTSVIGFLSSRKNIEYVSEYVQNIYNMSRSSPKELLDYTNYTSPKKSGTQVQIHHPSQSLHCGSNPLILFAEKSKVIKIENLEKNTLISWQPLPYDEIVHVTQHKRRAISPEVKTAHFESFKWN